MSSEETAGVLLTNYVTRGAHFLPKSPSHFHTSPSALLRPGSPTQKQLMVKAKDRVLGAEEEIAVHSFQEKHSIIMKHLVRQI